jgi:hypothetical protein
MKNCLKRISQRLRTLAPTLALAACLLPFGKAQAQGIIQTRSYGIWNSDTRLYSDNQGVYSETKKNSQVYLKAEGLTKGIESLNFYVAGISDPSRQLYEFNEENFIPITNVKISNRHGTSWHIESIENLGKAPRIFGLTNNLVYLTGNPTNPTINTNEHVRVFNRDLYKVILATSNNQAYTDFNLDLDLITDEANATNINETCMLGVLYDKTTNPNGQTTYFGYINRVFGEMGKPLDASKEDWNTNGIANSFEATYSSSPTGMTANADNDGDGLKNKDEARIGTNPNDITSGFRVTNFKNQNNNAEITWQGPAYDFFNEPVNYAVTKSTNLENTVWTVVASNLQTRTFSDTNTTSKAFYRVEVQ